MAEAQSIAAPPKPPSLQIEQDQEAALIAKYGMRPKLSPRLLAKVMLWHEHFPAWYIERWDKCSQKWLPSLRQSQYAVLELKVARQWE